MHFYYTKSVYQNWYLLEKCVYCSLILFGDNEKYCEIQMNCGKLRVIFLGDE